jgi:hypothetical protein
LIRSEYYDVTGKVYVAKGEDAEMPFLAQKPDRPYAVIGTVKVMAQPGTPEAAVNEELKKRARAAGADALMDVVRGEDTKNTLEFCGKVFSTKKNISARATAIVYTS